MKEKDMESLNQNYNSENNLWKEETTESSTNNNYINNNDLNNDKNRKGKIIVLIILIILLIILLILIFRFIFKKSYNVTFETDGGTYIEPFKINSDGLIEKPEDPKKEGYVFVGWYYNDELFDFNTKIEGDILLVAKWGEVSGIKFNTETLSLLVDKKEKLEVIFTGNVEDKTLEWKSSNEEIATVDKEGYVTAIKEGEAVVSVVTEDGKYSADLKITVTKEAILVTSVTIDSLNEVTIGNNIKLDAKIAPENATNQKVKWEVNDTTRATIDETGYLKGIAPGVVVVTVTTEDGEFTATKEINIKSIEQPTTQAPIENQNTTKKTTTKTTTTTKKVVPVNSVKITGNNVVVEGKTIQLTASISPSNATNKSVTWTSSNNSIAKVDKNGVVTGVKAGNVVITVTTQDGKKIATHEVKVKEKPGTYVITFTAIQTTAGVKQYNFSLTRNGVPFTTGYDWIDIGSYGNPFPASQKVSASTVEKYIKGNSKATISIVDPNYVDIDGSSVTASIVIK